jgi:DNA helicase IV
LTSADLDLLLCLHQIAGRGFKGSPATASEPTFYQSVFIDEVQDFTEQQVFLMAEQARPEYRAVTVAGDLAQKLHNGSCIAVRACFPSHKLEYVKLTENLRQAESPGLALFSACFREVAHGDGDGLERAVACLEDVTEVGRPRMRVCESAADLDERILKELEDVPSTQTLAVVFPSKECATAVFDRLKSSLATRMITAELSSHVDLSKRFVRHFAEVENTKGLEFDVVILPMLEMFDLDRELDRNRLYVAVTRARKRLVFMSCKRELHPVMNRVVERYQQILGLPGASSTASATYPR